LKNYSAYMCSRKILLVRWGADQRVTLTLFPTAYFFCGSHGGGGIHPPNGKSTSECLSPILFYTVNYTYIRSSDPNGFFPSFKTLDLVPDLSSAANSTYTSNSQKSKIYKGKSSADFTPPPLLPWGIGLSRPLSKDSYWRQRNFPLPACLPR
jgi:hypothetical protein